MKIVTKENLSQYLKEKEKETYKCHGCKEDFLSIELHYNYNIRFYVCDACDENNNEKRV